MVVWEANDWPLGVIVPLRASAVEGLVVAVTVTFGSFGSAPDVPEVLPGPPLVWLTKNVIWSVRVATVRSTPTG